MKETGLQRKLCSIKEYFQSKGKWYFFSMGVTLATLISVFSISENAFPLSYLRYIPGLIFLCWLPGFCFAKTLSLERSYNKTVGFILNIPLSLGLVFIIGLVVNFFPGGLRLTSVVGAMAVFIVASATVALFLDQRRIRKTDSNTNDTSENKIAGLHYSATWTKK